MAEALLHSCPCLVAVLLADREADKDFRTAAAAAAAEAYFHSLLAEVLAEKTRMPVLEERKIDSVCHMRSWPAFGH